MASEIYPAILVHTVEEYTTRLALIEASASTWAHIDIMDGQFVPNITVMPHELMSIGSRLNLEAHVMTYRPERYFSDLTVAGVSRVLLHREVYESLEECAKALHQATDYFSEVGLVINPDTPIEEYTNLGVTSIQCMGVHPGASGQVFLDEAYGQVAAVAAQKLPVVIAVDGGVEEENIGKLQELGVTRFVINSRLFATNNLSSTIQYFSQLLVGGV